jgi:hypothetical protein
MRLCTTFEERSTRVRESPGFTTRYGPYHNWYHNQPEIYGPL